MKNESLDHNIIQDTCTHCYGTGKDHGDESMETTCPSCNGYGFTVRCDDVLHILPEKDIIKGGSINLSGNLF